MHTLGPWKTEKRASCTAIISEQKTGLFNEVVFLSDSMKHNGKPCGSIESQGVEQSEIDSNAVLIAAAPDLLDACAEAFILLKNLGYDYTADLCRNAINKATDIK